MLPLVLTAENRRRCSANLRSFGGNCNGWGTHFLAEDLTVDHIIARSKGGTGHLDNLQLLCGHCNSLKGEACDGVFAGEIETRIHVIFVDGKSQIGIPDHLKRKMFVFSSSNPKDSVVARLSKLTMLNRSTFGSPWENLLP